MIAIVNDNFLTVYLNYQSELAVIFLLCSSLCIDISVSFSLFLCLFVCLTLFISILSWSMILSLSLYFTLNNRI